MDNIFFVNDLTWSFHEYLTYSANNIMPSVFAQYSNFYSFNQVPVLEIYSDNADIFD